MPQHFRLPQKHNQLYNWRWHDCC